MEKTEARIRAVAGERQGSRCHDCGAKLNPYRAELRQRRYLGRWEQPIPAPQGAAGAAVQLLLAAAVIYSVRHLRRGLRACERAGIDLREITRASGIPRNHLQRVLDGRVTWATQGAVRSLLEALPPAVRRAVEEPTLASAVATQAGAVPVALLLPVLEQEVERHGVRNAAHWRGWRTGRCGASARSTGRSRSDLADRLLTATGNAILWHIDPQMRRAYFGYGCPERVLRSGTRRRVPVKQTLVAA